MARTKKTETAASEAVQDALEQAEVSQDAQDAETSPAASEGRQEDAVTREEIGPDSEEDLLGCQDADEAELAEVECIEYAVTGCERLNLREEPSLDANIITCLPCGVGVLGSTNPVENGWRLVFTGRLVGWVMDEFLEALEAPEFDDGAE